MASSLPQTGQNIINHTTGTSQYHWSYRSTKVNYNKTESVFVENIDRPN